VVQVLQARGMRRKNPSAANGRHAHDPRLFRKAEWWEIYDLAESLVKMCGRGEEMASRIEAIFSEANEVDVCCEDGTIETIQNPRRSQLGRSKNHREPPWRISS